MTKVIARLWYTPGSRIVSLDLLQRRLTENLGCSVEKTETSDLRITAPAPLLVRLQNDDNIALEASELSKQIRSASNLKPASDKLNKATRRLDFGAQDDCDPQDPQIKGILTGLTSGLDGVLEDCVNGRLSIAPRAKKSFMQKLLRR
ncbi:hypothetical protein Q4578_07160 [Shimia thalassica]|uniref:hypothetical protein n=1 Tax=Shimia thalassica TaxID=1715693 RepID=UPI0026E25D30|nr:hypothetical protein [Shimia thalassica]MDO6483700.1 hypothetical protein [Shimia thalassica]MDO6521359.1 hypothetical protein [Shimia thalassica]